MSGELPKQQNSAADHVVVGALLVRLLDWGGDNPYTIHRLRGLASTTWM